MASRTYRPVLLLALAACAEGAPADDVDARQDPVVTIDAAEPGDQDGPVEGAPDAAESQPMIDAAPGAPDAAPSPPDAAPPPPDASVPPPDAGCAVRDLLTNGNFDDPTRARGWTEVGNNEALVTNKAGDVSAQSGSFRLWLAGYNLASERVQQDVVVPAGATNLVLAGVREVRTTESGSTVFDSSRVQIRQGSSVLETLATFSNRDATTSWTAISLPLTGSYGGQTIRLWLDTTTDSSNRTSFFYDSLTLTATVCP